jgi:hypothetical protein
MDAGSRDRLKGLGHEPRILLTRDAATVDAQISEALRESRYDVIVIGAGLRTLPPMTEQFERLINVLHEKAPQAKRSIRSLPTQTKPHCAGYRHRPAHRSKVPQRSKSQTSTRYVYQRRQTTQRQSDKIYTFSMLYERYYASEAPDR